MKSNSKIANSRQSLVDHCVKEYFSDFVSEHPTEEIGKREMVRYIQRMLDEKELWRLKLFDALWYKVGCKWRELFA